MQSWSLKDIEGNRKINASVAQCNNCNFLEQCNTKNNTSKVTRLNSDCFSSEYYKKKKGNL